ncbi:SDR family oxidoreductase [Mycobacterium sp. 21AC1]|uniref:SDR family NAD(P)-dependent oxidoreductase n=1 Tax=[Mycobacterium] appelbergii TaxID=2939269 RepID=UPI00293939BD|nr:SDR family oxidoreductase [Mycobacterium sp. 21AC1]MDV3124124.1 SDR family oxidoreductase [Mycobacterium sp. 21AC1]
MTEHGDPFRLDGEVALITGGTGGLGMSLCRAFAAAGAAVAVHHLDDAYGADTLASDLTAGGAAACAVQGDITDQAAVNRMFDEVAERFGRCTVLVNNAGMMEETAFVDMPRASWDRTIAADLTGPMLMSQRFTRQPEPRGAIVNVSSQLALKGAHNFVSYSAAKAGVLGLTRAMARELGPDIRVNAIAPGPVLTPLITDLATDSDWVHQRTQGSVTREIATPEQVAPTVVFLASPAAALLHGQTLHVNGGGVMP